MCKHSCAFTQATCRDSMVLQITRSVFCPPCQSGDGYALPKSVPAGGSSILGIAPLLAEVKSPELRVNLGIGCSTNALLVAH